MPLLPSRPSSRGQCARWAPPRSQVLRRPRAARLRYHRQLRRLHYLHLTSSNRTGALLSCRLPPDFAAQRASRPQSAFTPPRNRVLPGPH